MDHNKLDSRREDKKTQFKGNNTPRSNSRTKCSYIHLSLSKYKMFPLSFVCFSSDSIPHFSQRSFLYKVLFLFNLSLPPVDCISDLLDACPIKALLKPLCVTVRLNITIQASFPHKCGQLVRCRTFNVVVATFILDFSRFTVDSLSETYPQKYGTLLRSILQATGLQSPTMIPEESSGDNFCSSLLTLVLVSLPYKLILLFDPLRATLHPRVWPTAQYSYLAHLSPQLG